MADTHLNRVPVPDGDILIHAGDLTWFGTVFEMIQALDWLGSLPHSKKIFTLGNHDWLGLRDPYLFRSLVETAKGELTYLQDYLVTVDGLKIYGSPYTPEFAGWAFMLPRGEPLRQKWSRIPDDVDILITHGPPYGIGDLTEEGKHEGCEELLQRILEVRPRYHISGHIHESYGVVETYGITFINASVLNRANQLVNAPIVLEIEP